MQTSKNCASAPMILPRPAFTATFALAVSLMSMPTEAQSAEERKAVTDTANADNLRRLGAQFQKDFERQEALVHAHLRTHTDKPRSFQKNGSTYYLKRIDDEGNPVYVTTKGAESAQHQPSERPINLDPTDGCGSR